MDRVTAAYLEALDATANGPTHQERSVGEADLGVLIRHMSGPERDALQHEVGD